LDVFLARRLQSQSRSALKKLIDSGGVWIDGKMAKPHHKVRGGQVIKFQVVDQGTKKVEPEDIPLDIFFEDEHLLVVNKPAGMMVHPASGIYTGTLVNALLHHSRGLSGVGGPLRAGIVHRLDKDTTGLLMAAKTDQAHRRLAEQLAQRTVRREYRAIVWGQFPATKGSIDSPIGRSRGDRKKMAVRLVEGRKAVTHYHVEEEFGLCSFLALKLETGRTHQIRVHLAHLGHPVLGDPKYGGRTRRLSGLSTTARAVGQELLKVMPRQALHARVLGFKHPITNTFMQFESDLPDDMEKALKLLQGRKG
jgi:23S rRNA pseudouridine1911/1915/1917 synthase